MPKKGKKKEKEVEEEPPAEEEEKEEEEKAEEKEEEKADAKDKDKVVEDEEDEDEEEKAAKKKEKKEKKKKKEKKEFKMEEDEEEEEEEESAATKADSAKEVEEKPAAAPAEPLKMEFRPHTSYPDITGPEEMFYCTVCGLPPDFCIYGPSWDKCRPIAMEKYPQYYPELTGISLEDAKAKAQEAAEKGKVKEKPGGKKIREKSPEVSIKKLARGGRKCVTSIAGLDGFGVKLEDAAKKFKKKFACGSAVVKGENGAPDTVDIQGDIQGNMDEDEVIDLICAEFKDVPREKVTFLEGGTKKKGKSGK